MEKREPMANEHGEWIMHGLSEDDPYCIKTVDELIKYINEIGFLPLFQNEIPGFSVEERTVPDYWWSDNIERDPWEWRRVIAGRGEIAYGKFFGKKAGFISKEWLPYFANARRDGYDFDARYDDELVKNRCKKIMDLFDDHEELYSFEMKKLAGFGKGGEKNFDGTITELQMLTYLVVKDFRQKKNKAGQPYGWSVAVYSTPEQMWGKELVRAAYAERAEVSRERILNYMKEIYPIATEKQIGKIIL